MRTSSPYRERMSRTSWVDECRVMEHRDGASNGDDAA